MDTGRPPDGSGYSAEPEPSCTVSAVPVSIPNAAHCCGCGIIIPEHEGRGWWHPECHEIATADVNRVMALRALAKMTGYTGP